MPERKDELPESQVQDVCPGCGSAVALDSAEGAILQCAGCGTQFFCSSADGELENAPSSPADADLELSALRIYQITQLRRTASRTRSYCVMGASACLVCAIQLVIMMIRLVRSGG